MKRIHESLQRAFQRSNIVFWYDATGEWKDTFKAFTDDSVVKLTVKDNEFGTKVRIVREPNPDAKFLVYVPSARPADPDNWLLDVLLQGYEYKADRASLDLQDVGLPVQPCQYECHRPSMVAFLFIDRVEQIICAGEHVPAVASGIEYANPLPLCNFQEVRFWLALNRVGHPLAEP